MFQVVTSYLQFAVGGFLSLFYALCAMYFAWKFSIYLAEAFIDYQPQSLQKCKKLLIAIVRIFIVMFVLFGIVSNGVAYINSRSMEPEYIMSVNHALMQADQVLFGVYPPLWLQDQHNVLKPLFDAAAPFIVGIYMNLAVFMSAAFLLLLMFRQHLFLEMFAVMVLCVVLGMPFWYLFPSLSPIEAFFIPLFDLQIAENIQNALATYDPNSYVLERIMDDADFVHSIQSSHMLVTTMPSMHAAWFAMSMYFVVLVWRPFVWAAVPLFFVNAISTLYIMQHYAVDQIAGLLIVVVAIIIARKMKLQPDRHLAFIYEVIREDVEELEKEVRALFDWQAR